MKWGNEVRPPLCEEQGAGCAAAVFGAYRPGFSDQTAFIKLIKCSDTGLNPGADLCPPHFVCFQLCECGGVRPLLAIALILLFLCEFYVSWGVLLLWYAPTVLLAVFVCVCVFFYLWGSCMTRPLSVFFCLHVCFRASQGSDVQWPSAWKTLWGELMRNRWRQWSCGPGAPGGPNINLCCIYVFMCLEHLNYTLTHLSNICIIT